LLKHGVTADQFVVLGVVSREPSIMQMTIAERTASDQNSMAAQLRLLEERGLIRRRVHSLDGRARCVSLTAEGRRILRQAESEAEPILAVLSDCLAEKDRRAVEKFLESVQQAFADPFVATNGKVARPSAKRKAAK
jgi:DNA-binding MarR family transcriptional regulator